MEDIRRYVVGFLFSESRNYVAMIRKNRPTWQAGKYNGIGGKVEPGETIIGAMHREFFEEAGLVSLPWENFATLDGVDFHLSFFRAFADEAFSVRTMTDEKVEVASVDWILGSIDLIPNLRVIIPLALDTSGIATPVQFRDDGRGR